VVRGQPAGGHPAGGGRGGHSAGGGRAAGAVPASVATALDGPGHPLEPSIRHEMSSLLGRDLAPVRVHTGPLASRSAADIGALAYAAGPHVVFGAGQYQPSTAPGRRLLAHELAHVAQQPVASRSGLVLGSPDSHAEVEAERFAESAAGAAGYSLKARGTAEPGIVQRQEASAAPAAGAPYIVISCSDMTISFFTPVGAESYILTACDIPADEYTATVNVTGNDLSLDFGESAEEGVRFAFSYTVAPGQRDPTQLFTVNGQQVSVEVEAVMAPGDGGELTSHVDEELVAELARLDAGGPGELATAAPAIPPGAVPLSSVVSPDAMYAFAPTAGFVSTTGYSAPPAVLAGEAAAAEAARSLVAARGLTAAATTTVRGATLARGLIAGGETILAVEAGGAAEFEVVAGPPGWVVGVIVLAVAGAAIGVGYLLLRPSAATRTEPAATPTATPATPTAAARRWPNQTCENDVLDGLQAAMHAICDTIPGVSCSPSKTNPKVLARTPCSQIRVRIQAIRACMAARQLIQDQCFGGVPDARHEKPMNELANALNHCIALEAVNCAEGHPMANL
jgi:hypothetical protein